MTRERFKFFTIFEEEDGSESGRDHKAAQGDPKKCRRGRERVIQCEGSV